MLQIIAGITWLYASGVRVLARQESRPISITLASLKPKPCKSRRLSGLSVRRDHVIALERATFLLDYLSDFVQVTSSADVNSLLRVWKGGSLQANSIAFIAARNFVRDKYLYSNWLYCIPLLPVITFFERSLWTATINSMGAQACVHVQSLFQYDLFKSNLVQAVLHCISAYEPTDLQHHERFILSSRCFAFHLYLLAS